MGRRRTGNRPSENLGLDNVFDVVQRDKELYEEWNTDWTSRQAVEERILREKQQNAKRFDAIAGVYRTADSILTGQSLSVSAGDFSGMNGTASNVPAWNDGSTIYLNTNVLKQIDDSSIVSLNGVNYHEVAHIIWSPRLGGKFAKRIVENKLHVAFNVLEDMRIETLMVSRFPATKLALTKATLSYILENADSNIYPLIRGRRFLPLEVRQRASDLFASAHGVELTQKVADIIDEYRLLAFPDDQDRAYELTEMLADLLKMRSGEKYIQNPNAGEMGEPYYIENPDYVDPEESKKYCGTGMCGDRMPLKSGRNEKGVKQKAQQGKVKAKDGEADSAGKGNTPSTGKSESTGTKSEVTAQGTSTGSSGDFLTYDKSQDTTEPVDNELAEMIKSALDELMASPQAKVEASQIRSALRQVDRAMSAVGKANSPEFSVDDEYKKAAKDFGHELNRLMLDNDPAWQRQNPTGKLNIQRAMNMGVNDLNTVFDRWYEGNDAYDIEAVILIDCSGSMGGRMGEASQAMWTIKKALEAIDSRVTVFVFNDDTRLLYGGDERVSSTFRSTMATGGTNPKAGLIEAERIFEASTRNTKLLFTISDGAWGDEQVNNNLVARINNIDGVISSAVLIVSQWWLQRWTPEDLKRETENARHNCHSVSVVTKSSELVNVARNLLRGLR